MHPNNTQQPTSPTTQNICYLDQQTTSFQQSSDSFAFFFRPNMSLYIIQFLSQFYKLSTPQTHLVLRNSTLGSAKDSNLNRIQIFQSKCLRQITKASFYVLNDNLYRDLLITTVKNFAKTRKLLKPPHPPKTLFLNNSK